jgi:hypothetical protein
VTTDGLVTAICDESTKRRCLLSRCGGKLKTEVPGVRKNKVFSKVLENIQAWVPNALKPLRGADEVEVSISFNGAFIIVHHVKWLKSKALARRCRWQPLTKSSPCLI